MAYFDPPLLAIGRSTKIAPARRSLFVLVIDWVSMNLMTELTSIPSYFFRLYRPPLHPADPGLASRWQAGLPHIPLLSSLQLPTHTGSVDVLPAPSQHPNVSSPTKIPSSSLLTPPSSSGIFSPFSLTVKYLFIIYLFFLLKV